MVSNHSSRLSEHGINNFVIILIFWGSWVDSMIHYVHMYIRLCEKTTKCLIEIRWHPKKVLLRLKMNWEKEKNNWSTFWYSSAGLKIWTPINKSQKINFIGGHTLLNKKCRKFYILGSKFFYFDEIAKMWLPGLKNPVLAGKWLEMAENGWKTWFFRSGSHIFAISSK